LDCVFVFKNLTAYRIGPGWTLNFQDLEAELTKALFVPCGLTQQKSSGWVPPRGKPHAPLIESIDGHLLLQLQSEQRVVPGSVVKRRTDEMADRIEQATGRRPGKKQTKELKEQALLELLPMAFTKQASTRVWLCPKERLVLLDTASQAWCDEITTLLVKANEGLALSMIHTEMSPSAAMAHWLGSGEAPYQFSIDRECELKSADEMKSVVSRQVMATRVSFLLTESLQLKKLAILDVVFEGSAIGLGKADQDEAFDANVAIAIGELTALLPDLLEALGGEQHFDRAVPMPGSLPTQSAAPQALAATQAEDAPPW